MSFKLQNDANSIIVSSDDLYISPKAWKELYSTYNKQEIMASLTY